MSSNPSTIINSSAPAARILVVGAGSTGGYVGAKLLKAGRDVTFLVRPARAATLRRTGLRLGGLDDLVLDPPVLTADRLDTTFDLVLLAVKATGLDAAVDDLAPAVGPSTAVIPFLNGIRHVDVLDQRFGGSRASALHFERFAPAPITDGRPFELQLGDTGRVLPVPYDRSALDVLHEALPDMPFSCRQGFCGTCRVRVAHGHVDHRDRRLTATERAAGAMLPCVSRAPEGERLVLEV